MPLGLLDVPKTPRVVLPAGEMASPTAPAAKKRIASRQSMQAGRSSGFKSAKLTLTPHLKAQDFYSDAV